MLTIGIPNNLTTSFAVQSVTTSVASVLSTEMITPVAVDLVDERSHGLSRFRLHDKISSAVAASAVGTATLLQAGAAMAMEGAGKIEGLRPIDLVLPGLAVFTALAAIVFLMIKPLMLMGRFEMSVGDIFAEKMNAEFERWNKYLQMKAIYSLPLKGQAAVLQKELHELVGQVGLNLYAAHVHFNKVDTTKWFPMTTPKKIAEALRRDTAYSVAEMERALEVNFAEFLRAFPTQNPTVTVSHDFLMNGGFNPYYQRAETLYAELAAILASATDIPPPQGRTKWACS